jgi:putative ABC transport system substrate-binding protein
MMLEGDLKSNSVRHGRRGALLTLAALAVAGVALGQARIARVGYLFSFTRLDGEHLWLACRQGLHERGYVEGKNILLEPRWAEGRHERLPALVADLVSSQVDVIVAAATPASLAAKAGAGSVPVVMVAVGDPVKVGLVASLSRPGGNVTGLTLLTPDLSGKRLQLVRELVGAGARHVAVLLNPANSVHDVFLEETRAAAANLGIRLSTRQARNAGEIAGSLEFRGGELPDALVVLDDPVLWSFRREIVALVARIRLPAVYGYADFVEEGGLISLGPDRPDHYRRTARYVDSILKGAKPADLPIERPTKFEMVVNARTARAQGLALSPSFLLRADRVIG